MAVGTGSELGRIHAAQAALGRGFAPEFASYLLAVDGVYDEGGGWFAGWPLDRIVTGAPRLWERGLPATMIPFGDNGCGEPFCVRSDDPAATCSVFHWKPIDHEINQLATSLWSFWTGWLDGTINT
jgi:hypothetical protein